LKASAYDAAGTKVAESSETVTVNNTSAPATTTTTPPPTTTTPPPPPPTTTTPSPPPPPTTTSGSSSGGSCFASPGSCGYPDPQYHNVGVPQGTTLTNSGSITVTTAGTVISGLNVTGTIDVRANNVTIQNTKVTCTTCGAGSAVMQESGYSNLVVKNSQVSGGSIDDFGNGATLDHVYLSNCGECTHYVVGISDSYIAVASGVVAGAHYEDFYGGLQTINIQHSVLLNPHVQTAVVFNSGNDGPCQNHTTINNSLIAGGGYAIYPCAHSSSAGSSVTTITNNRFARCVETLITLNGHYVCTGFPFTGDATDGYVALTDGHGYYPDSGSYGLDDSIYCGQTTWSNNVWDDNGATAGC
jgi:hypothetical protein